MDPPNPQHSDHHAASTSQSHSHARSGSGGSTGTLPPSVINHPPEPPPQGGGSSSNTETKNSTGTEEEGVDITGNSTPSHHATKSSTRKEIEEDTATSGSTRKWLETVGLLSDFLAFKNRTGPYASLPNDVHFYDVNWIRLYKPFETREEIDAILDGLRQTYRKIRTNHTEFPTDPDGIEAYRISDLLWGDVADSTDNSGEETTKDSSDGNDSASNVTSLK